MKNKKTIVASALDVADEEELDCVPGTVIPKTSVGASDFDKPMTDEEREKAIESEMPHCAPAVKAWVRQNKLPMSYMWQLESLAKEGKIFAKGENDSPANVENPLFGTGTFAEYAASLDDDQAGAKFEMFMEGHTDEDRYAGGKVESLIKQLINYWDEPYLTDERAKEIAIKPFGGHTNSKNDVNVNCDIGVTYNRRIFFGTDGKFQHGHELLPCLGSLGEAQSLRVLELDVPSQCSERGYPVLELTTDRGTYHITNCGYEPADCGSWFFSVEMPWASFGKFNDPGIVLCHDIRVSAALVQNGLSSYIPDGVTRKRGLRSGSKLPLMREEDAWDFFWNLARYASGMGGVWSTLTWVDEKGETVFDPSATGDEAECQRTEIDRLERELLLRGIVMCPRGPILERVRPWTGVLESLERFQSARRDHYSRLVQVMKGSS